MATLMMRDPDPGTSPNHYVPLQLSAGLPLNGGFPAPGSDNTYDGRYCKSHAVASPHPLCCPPALIKSTRTSPVLSYLSYPSGSNIPSYTHHISQFPPTTHSTGQSTCDPCPCMPLIALPPWDKMLVGLISQQATPAPQCLGSTAVAPHVDS